MSCIKRGGRVTLIVVNVIFLLTSLGLITIGVIILQGYTTVFKKHIDSTVDDIQKDVAITFGQFIPSDLSLLYRVYSNFGIGLTISGSVLLILSALGLLGSSCKWPNILFVYAFAISVLIAAQIVFICLVFFQKDKIRNAVKKPMKDLIKNYEGSNGTSEESWAWKFIMRKGCLDAVWDALVTDNAGYLITGGFVLFVCQFLTVIFSCILYCDKDEKEDGQNGGRNRVHPYDGRTFRQRPRRDEGVVSPRTVMSSEDQE